MSAVKVFELLILSPKNWYDGFVIQKIFQELSNYE